MAFGIFDPDMFDKNREAIQQEEYEKQMEEQKNASAAGPAILLERFVTWLRALI